MSLDYLWNGQLLTVNTQLKHESALKGRSAHLGFSVAISGDSPLFQTQTKLLKPSGT